MSDEEAWRKLPAYEEAPAWSNEEASSHEILAEMRDRRESSALTMTARRSNRLQIVKVEETSALSDEEASWRERPDKDEEALELSDEAAPALSDEETS